MKVLGWFSGGVTSAVAIKKVLELTDHDVEIYYFETGSHHPDHDRFLEDCEKWYGQKINIVKNPKFTDVIDVIRTMKYVNGPSGARCTYDLKKQMRWNIEKEVNYDAQIFGFEDSPKEINRAIRFQEQYPDAKAHFPLIELNLDKPTCMKIIQQAGIELPEMYKLGYHNSNCIGCVKGGMGYWNKIREDFPDHFDAMAKVEREIGRSCIKGVFLDELKKDRGRHRDISLPSCGVVCQPELMGLDEKTERTMLINRFWP
ncbi:phosphoadenosine phosphosulfate reductase family protein [Flavobacterium alkalisoli]|uniref:phosphoadenosine phosphosulfate reductase domain-containing protein n=1 Tax=Flavobacterium alkalisoli TaxID=2602769 RepID=UPI003A92F653